MQVTNVPITPPVSSETVSRPVEREAASPAEPRERPAEKALERALVEAAGLNPAEAATVRVTLSIDKDSNRVIAKMFDKTTGELVRQIPTDAVLHNAAFVREFLGANLNKLA